jgi:hypothetical protein
LPFYRLPFAFRASALALTVAANAGIVAAGAHVDAGGAFVVWLQVAEAVGRPVVGIRPEAGSCAAATD